MAAFVITRPRYVLRKHLLSCQPMPGGNDSKYTDRPGVDPHVFNFSAPGFQLIRQAMPGGNRVRPAHPPYSSKRNGT